MQNKNKKISSKREKQTRYLSQAIQLEEAVNPHILRVTMTMVSLALIAFIVWAGFTNINEVARTPGEIIPAGYQQTVQHLEGGLVKNIHVKEGDIVKQDQILLSLNETGIKEDLTRTRLKQLSYNMQIERLRAFIDGRQPDFDQFEQATVSMIADQQTFFQAMRGAREKEEKIIQKQITQKQQSVASLQTELNTAQNNLAISKDMYDRRVKLNQKGYASDIQLMEDKRAINDTKGDIDRLKNNMAMAETEIEEYKDRLESLSARHRDEANQRLDQVMAEKAQNAELIEKLNQRVKRLQVRAPVEGYIKGLAVNTVGAVIQPGQTLMEIVPLNNNLHVSVKIAPQDIGHLKIGQPVQIKFSTFDFSRYGSVQGTLDYISATTFSGDDKDRYYQGRVLLDKTYVGNDPNNTILPGMTVMADVITGEKTILQYILKPIHVSFKTAFRER